MQVRIPGKVMLSGEYTVLLGGTAVLVPVPRYLTLTTLDSSEPSGDTPVIREALAEPIPELTDQEADLPPIHVAADRHQFLIVDAEGRVQKLGLGGSAAEAVGTIALRFQRCGIDWKPIPDTIFKYADNAHRRAQGGLGSGADVAAIAYRRPIRFKRVNDQVEIEVIEKPAPEFIPPLALAWTGISANTREFVPKFMDFARREPDHDKLASMERRAADIAQSWFTQPRGELDSKLDFYINSLVFGLRKAGIEWMIPRHVELYDWMQSNLGWAKPTGAGGGDMALLIGHLPPENRPELIIPLDPFAEI